MRKQDVDLEAKDAKVPRADPPTVLTPEIAGKMIRYALSELSADNAHHDFEHLCRHIARRRICSNIIPATGPVSGGGDRGADFETVHVESAFGVSQYWRLASAGKVLFACSLAKNLKKKIKADVKAAADFGEPLERMYFFYPFDIKTGDRNKFKEAALDEYGIRLEIIDGYAIAEFLSDPELVWIAEKYLSLPSEIALPSRGHAPTWYSSLLEIPESELPTNSDTFYQVKSAIRYACADPDRHSDVPKFIRRLLLFSSHPDRTIARKAFYEEFVAALRGLNAAEGYESKIIEYLSAISHIDNPSELEDASIILSYTNGACARGILKIEMPTRRRFRDDLLRKLDFLLTSAPNFDTCSLLFTKGHVLLISAALDNVSDRQNSFALARALENAIEVWDALLKKSEEVPLFPVERLSELVSFVFPFVTSDQFAAFVKRIDAITSKRAGSQSLAEQHLKRATALLDAKDYLRALREFHESLRLSHSSKSQSKAITVCLQLSALYQHVGLHHAAKYYGLAAAFAALSLPEDDLRRLASVGLAQAVQADYATGASLMFFLTFTSFVTVANEFAMAGKRSFREKEWAKVDYYALLLTRAAKIIGSGCHDLCMERLRRVGAQDTYAATENHLDEFFANLDRPALAARYAKEGIACPFSDYSRIRITSWKQLGITWRVEWSSDYESEKQGAALCAVLQIVLAALSGTEFSVITTGVTIVIDTTHSGEEQVQQLGDNNVLRFSVAVDPTRGLSLQGQLTIVYLVFLSSSSIPSDEFGRRFEDEFKSGLPERIGVYVSPGEVFRQFYSNTDYDDLHPQVSNEPPEPPEPLATRTWEGISEIPALHPQFVESEALQLIKNRYDRCTELFPYTLRRLSPDSTFQEVVSKLRQSGWKDWHILLAVVNLRLSSLINTNDPDYNQLARSVMQNGERIQDPPTPASFFDEKRLRMCLQLSQTSTIKSMGLRISQMTPNFAGVDAFLNRFKYWDLDVPHADPFAGPPPDDTV